MKISPESSSKKSSSHVTLPESITISFKSMNICYTFQKLPKKKIDSQRDCFPHYLVSNQLRPLQKHLHSKRGRITRTNSIYSHSTAPVLKTHSSPKSPFSPTTSLPPLPLLFGQHPKEKKTKHERQLHPKGNGVGSLVVAKRTANKIRNPEKYATQGERRSLCRFGHPREEKVKQQQRKVL